MGSQTEGGIPATTWNGDRYLEITVNGETLTPRELIRSAQIIPGTQITLTADATDLNYLIDITADFILTNSISIAQLYIDGVPSEQGQAIFQSQFAGRGTVSQTYLVPVSPGTAKKVDLRATLFAKVNKIFDSIYHFFCDNG